MAKRVGRRRKLPWTDGKYILNDQGEPELCHNLFDWAEWMEKTERHLGDDTIDGAHVSTMFFGIDLRLLALDDGAPVLWETMVFGGKYDMSQERYASREAALAGHARWVQRVRDGEIH